MNSIRIRGAKQNNLKNLDLEIPLNQLTVITGVSGSGKSTLAFDILYAEGQRRYVESLSAYARQFLGQMDKPDVDAIEGLSPAISIDQKTTSRNPRSTVGTVTEIFDYLRLLYARIGKPVCPKHGIEISSQTIQQMVDRLLEFPERTKMQILAPLVSGRKGTHVKVLEDIKKQGYVRVRVDGEMREVAEEIELEKNKKHSIEVVIDRVVIKEGIQTRLADSLESALTLADGRVLVDVIGEEELAEVDQQYLKFGRAFEHEFINQGPTENRTIEQTLNIGWRLLSVLPQEELTRVSLDEIKQYYKPEHANH